MDRLTAEIARRAEQTLQEVARMERAVQRKTRALGPAVSARYAALARELGTHRQRLAGALEQTHLRLQRFRAIPDRLVSLFDPDPRRMRRRKLAKPVAFGYKLGVTETQEGFISHSRLYKGNPADARLLAHLVQGHALVLGTPRAVVTDRGMSHAANGQALRAMSGRQVALAVGRSSKRGPAGGPSPGLPPAGALAQWPGRAHCPAEGQPIPGRAECGHTGGGGHLRRQPDLVRPAHDGQDRGRPGRGGKSPAPSPVQGHLHAYGSVPVPVAAFLERRVRRELAAQRDVLIIGGKRKTQAPTLQAIFDLFRSLQAELIDTEREVQRVLPRNTNPQIFKMLRLAGYSEAIYIRR